MPANFTLAAYDDLVVREPDESVRDSATSFKGYSIIRARDRKAVISLLKDHPFPALGSDEYGIETFELPKEQRSI
jgi:hypothetical protein